MILLSLSSTMCATLVPLMIAEPDGLLQGRRRSRELKR
jgi:hypothetical protein